jgi:UPF0176 protein
MSLPVLNISAYKFTPIDDCAALRERLHDQATTAALKGTILLAEEGINLFLAGAPEGLQAFLRALRADPRFTDLVAKESWSDAAPFQHLRVKVKPEIIRMNHPTVRPDAAPRAPAVSPETLARWLRQGHDDTGRAVVTLDTRNAFEVDHGTFVNAIDWRLDKFSDFPAAVAAHKEELADKTVVSFCTGGIRCEKAALFMQRTGLDAVYQLDGGILKYLEAIATDPQLSEHWRGDCFVFDERRTLNKDLQRSV